MKVSFKLLESNTQISNSILKALLPEIDSYLKKALFKIRQSLREIIRDIIHNTPEYNSLMGGQLQYEFGIANPSSQLATIIDIWSNNIITEYNSPVISGNSIKASFSISLIRSDFNDVLSSDAGFVIDNFRGYQLPWLEWLLLEGNKTIVSKQEVVIGPSKFSRTGFALMRPSNKSWRVPSEFAGTLRDNWITRAIDNSESQINELLDKVFLQ